MNRTTTEQHTTETLCTFNRQFPAYPFSFVLFLVPRSKKLAGGGGGFLTKLTFVFLMQNPAVCSKAPILQAFLLRKKEMHLLYVGIAAGRIDRFWKGILQWF